MSPQRMQPPPTLQEPLEMLKGRIMGQLNGKFAGPFALGFISCIRGEGVTAVASNFAASLAADLKRRIVFMDGNLHTPTKDNPLLNGAPHPEESADGHGNGQETNGANGHGHAPDNEEGAGELQLPARPIWQMANAHQNIDLMYSRVPFSNPGRVYGASRFGELLKQLKEHYDFIVVDCPPLMGVSGAAMLASQCDGAILVLEAGRVRRQVVQRCIQNLEATGANILGIVLNKRVYPIPDFIYKRL